MKLNRLVSTSVILQIIAAGAIEATTKLEKHVQKQIKNMKSNNESTSNTVHVYSDKRKKNSALLSKVHFFD